MYVRGARLLVGIPDLDGVPDAFSRMQSNPLPLARRFRLELETNGEAGIPMSKYQYM